MFINIYIYEREQNKKAVKKFLEGNVTVTETSIAKKYWDTYEPDRIF